MLSKPLSLGLPFISAQEGLQLPTAAGIPALPCPVASCLEAPQKPPLRILLGRLLMKLLVAQSQKGLWDALEAFSPFQSKLKKVAEGKF